MNYESKRLARWLAMPVCGTLMRWWIRPSRQDLEDAVIHLEAKLFIFRAQLGATERRALTLRQQAIRVSAKQFRDDLAGLSRDMEACHKFAGLPRDVRDTVARCSLRRTTGRRKGK